MNPAIAVCGVAAERPRHRYERRIRSVPINDAEQAMGRVADVVDFESEMASQFTLDPEIPLLHVGNVEVWINRRRKREGKLRQVGAGSRLRCRDRYIRYLIGGGCRSCPRVYRVHIGQRKRWVSPRVAGKIEEVPGANNPISKTYRRFSVPERIPGEAESRFASFHVVEVERIRSSARHLDELNGRRARKRCRGCAGKLVVHHPRGSIPFVAKAIV